MNRAPSASIGRQLGICSLLASLSACLIALSPEMPASALGLDRSPNQDDDPVADAWAVVGVDNGRFTILTSPLIPMEWSPDGAFVDRASLVSLTRQFLGSQREGRVGLKRALTLDEILVRGRTGSIVSMKPRMRHTGVRPVLGPTTFRERRRGPAPCGDSRS